MRKIAFPVALFMAITTACGTPTASAEEPVSTAYVQTTINNYCNPLGSHPARSLNAREGFREELSDLRTKSPEGWRTLNTELRNKADAVIDLRRAGC